MTLKGDLIVPQKEGNEYVFSLRIKPSLLKEIEDVARKENMTKSDFIRKAISDAMSFSEMFKRNQTFLVSPKMMEFALNLMNDSEIERFALMSIQNGQDILKTYLKYRSHSTIVKQYLDSKKTMITGLLKYIIYSILAPTGQEWFQRIQFTWDENKVIIAGIHKLGEKFSRFILFYFTYFFRIFACTECENIRILKEDRLKIGFTGDMKEFDIKLLM